MKSEVYHIKTVIAELSLLLVTCVSTYLMGLTLGMREQYVTPIIRGTIAVIELVIVVAISTKDNIRMEGGIMVYYLYRLVMSWHTDTYTLADNILPACLAYLTFKMSCLAIIKMQRFQLTDYKNKQQRQILQKNESKRRNISLFLLFAISAIFLAYNLSPNYSKTSIIIFFINSLLFSLQIYYTNSAETDFFKILSNSLSYNLYLYPALSFVLGKYFFNNAFHFLVPTLTYLIFSVAILRVIIGSNSDKFHSSDKFLFDSTYIFKGDNSHHYYRHEQNYQRNLRVLDKISRQISEIVYYLSFLAVIFLGKYLYFAIGIFLVVKLQLNENITFSLILKYLNKLNKYNVSFVIRPKLAIPICILFLQLSNCSVTDLENLYDRINQCNFNNTIQLIYSTSLLIMIVVSQFCKRRYKNVIFMLVEGLCPGIVIMWGYMLECLHLRLFLLGLYTLAYCFETIRSGRMAKYKGAKKE